VQLSLLNFPSLVSNTAAAVQSKCSKLLNLTVGSVLRSIIEAFASTGLWIQYLIVQVWAGCRLSTSTGTDVDTFVGDFSLTRLPALPSSGTCTFGRFSISTAVAVMPYFNADGSVNTAGAQVLTADLTTTFGVSTNTAHPLWYPSLGGYLIPIGVPSADLPVTALVAGSAGNIQAQTIALLAGSGVPGIDTVTNAAPFQNGQDPETDDALKVRFANYINTRSRGTTAAVEYAISSVQQGLSSSLVENSDASGNYDPGHFIVTIDDGTGNPPASLISAVYAAIDAVRPIGSRFAVFGPVDVMVTVSMTITVGPSGNKSILIGTVQNAVLDYIDALPIGAILPWSRLAQIAFDADPSITNVSQIALNGTVADVVAPANGVIKAASVAIN
jgi:uncharacterized phage protein gp47/JayE